MKTIKVIHFCDRALTWVMVLFFLLISAFGGYALYDNMQGVKAGDSSLYATYNPKDALSFAQLQKINPDVFGWLTINHTNIDYPLLQGEDNDTYINTDPKGNFSLAGSLFLDYRNKQDFSDQNSIIYGHNIEGKKMFGQLQNYRDQSFFKKHLKGKIYYQNKWHTLKIMAYIHSDAYKSIYYEPHIDQSRLLVQIKKDATYLDELSLSSNEHLVTLSTCTNADTNGRYILIGKLND